MFMTAFRKDSRNCISIVRCKGRNCIHRPRKEVTYLNVPGKSTDIDCAADITCKTGSCKKKKTMSTFCV
jgi:hypothetical protein